MEGLTREELREELEIMLDRTIKKSVQETFCQLGMDVTKPTELQRDFMFLRDMRTTAESVRCKAIITGVGVIVVGTLAAFWLGFKTMITK